MSLEEIGTDETYTVRLEPLPAAIITTIEDIVTDDRGDELVTTAEPDRPLTAAELLFGSSAAAPEALAKQIVTVGRGQNLGRVLQHLPRVTQDAAIREAALAAAGAAEGRPARRPRGRLA